MQKQNTKGSTQSRIKIQEAQQEQEKNSRQKALEFARNNVPKPKVALQPEKMNIKESIQTSEVQSYNPGGIGYQEPPHLNSIEMGQSDYQGPANVDSTGGGQMINQLNERHN